MSTTYDSKQGLAGALKARGFSQAEFARSIGKSEAQVNRWVNRETVPNAINRGLVLRALNEPLERGEIEGHFFTDGDIWGGDRG